MASYSENLPTALPPSTSQRSTLPPETPVSSQPLSFSISRILGLEDSISQHEYSSIYGNDNYIYGQERSANTNQQKSDGSRNTDSKNPSTDGDSGGTKKSRQSSDRLPSVDSDNPSSDGDSGRESDTGRSSSSSAGRPKKRNQRTTFSSIELKELEHVFAKRPYLMSEDEDELVRKLGLTRRNVRFWFQNRRAKLKRQERAIAYATATGLPLYQIQSSFMRESQSAPSSGHLTHAHFYRPHAILNNTEYSIDAMEKAFCPCCSVQSNRFPVGHVSSSSRQDYLAHPSSLFY
ncbi:homeobox protein prophet of Pit-1-like [Montipora capricornis]|uniref:homeobox protein prophet of Pit-1-like n=1 Tax=Montipora capricornis TaxID=246305 RepID=UPI0035F20C37